MMHQNILDQIVAKSEKIFEEELVGVYLHGSLAMGCFNPDRSDIDVLIVIKKNITDKQKMKFMEDIVELNKLAPSKGIELSIVKKEYCQVFLYPTPFELHFSNMHFQWFMDNPIDYINKMQGTDKDLAAHFTIIKRYGIVLSGEAIEDVFAEVPRENYIDSIWNDIEGAKEEILENPVYIILNLCRVVAFLKDNLITSKKSGGEWALHNLESEYQNIISNALQSYEYGKDVHINEEDALRFSEYMLMIIKSILLSEK